MIRLVCASGRKKVCRWRRMYGGSHAQPLLLSDALKYCYGVENSSMVSETLVLSHASLLPAVKTMAHLIFKPLNSDDGLAQLNDHLLPLIFIDGGWKVTSDDMSVYNALTQKPDAVKYPHVARWWTHITAVLGARYRAQRQRQYLCRGPPAYFSCEPGFTKYHTTLFRAVSLPARA